MGVKKSKLETTLGEIWEPLGFTYESTQVEYQVPKKYTPDFSLGPFHVEVKGWFRPGDRQKYKAIRDAMEDQDLELIFFLQHPNKPCQKGAKITMSQWCEKEDIAWFSDPDKLAWYVLGGNMVVP